MKSILNIFENDPQHHQSYVKNSIIPQKSPNIHSKIEKRVSFELICNKKLTCGYLSDPYIYVIILNIE